MGMVLFFKSTLPHPGLHLETRRRTDGTEQGYWVADPEIKDAREVTYTIASVGRKWLKGRAPGKNYDVQIEINDRSRGWKPGDTVTFHARSEYKSSRFGSTTSVFPLTEGQEKAARIASQIGEIERWLGYVEEKATSGYLYGKGVDTLRSLGIKDFPEYNDRLSAAIDTAADMDRKQREAKANELAAADEKARRGEVAWLNVPYKHKDYAKVNGAKWSPDERKWYVIGDVPQALEQFAEPKDEELPDGSFKISGGSGYGHPEYIVGQVTLAPVGGAMRYVVPLRARKKYYRHDGMSFGVGESNGYMYSADVRFATEDETKRFLGASPESSAEPFTGEVYSVGGGSGYGYHDFVVGKVTLAPVNGVTQYVVPLRSSKRYFREDGLSFGVGDDSGYVYSADVRLATEDEIKKSDVYIEQQRRKMKGASYSVASAASDLIRKIGDAPEDASNLAKEGEVVVIDENLYGGRDSFLIQKDWIWFIKYNGSDGDDWSRNNMPGEIGWRIPRNEGLVDVLRLANKVKDASLDDIGLVEKMENKFAAVRTDMSRPSRGIDMNAGDSPASGPSEFAMRMLWSGGRDKTSKKFASIDEAKAFVKDIRNMYSLRSGSTTINIRAVMMPKPENRRVPGIEVNVITPTGEVGNFAGVNFTAKQASQDYYETPEDVIARITEAGATEKPKKPTISDATLTSIGQKLSDSVKWRRPHYDHRQLDMFAKSLGMVLMLRCAP